MAMCKDCDREIVDKGMGWVHSDGRLSYSHDATPKEALFTVDARFVTMASLEDLVVVSNGYPVGLRVKWQGEWLVVKGYGQAASGDAVSTYLVCVWRDRPTLERNGVVVHTREVEASENT